MLTYKRHEYLSEKWGSRGDGGFDVLPIQHWGIMPRNHLHQTFLWISGRVFQDEFGEGEEGKCWCRGTGFICGHLGECSGCRPVSGEWWANRRMPVRLPSAYVLVLLVTKG
jgi:hypothetical protein